MNTPTLPMESPREAADPVRLEPHAIHCWWLRPPEAEAVPEGVDDVLSDDERRRADRFRSPRDRAAFVVARAGLRTLLAAYTGDRPDRVTIRARPGGKPEIAGRWGRTVDFNLAHTDGLVVYAIARNNPVGIDVERVRRFEDAALIAQTFFSEREKQVVLALDGERRDRAFYRLWVRKEAILKASGDGLSVPLERVDVTLGCEEDPPLGAGSVAIGHDEGPGRWRVSDLTPPHPCDQTYLVALAHRDPVAHVRHAWLRTTAVAPGFAPPVNEGVTCRAD